MLIGIFFKNFSFSKDIVTDIYTSPTKKIIFMFCKNRDY